MGGWVILGGDTIVLCLGCDGGYFPGGSHSKESACKAEDWACSLGWEDSLEKGMATHYSILAWRIPWTEEPGRPQPMELQRVGHD